MNKMIKICSLVVAMLGLSGAANAANQARMSVWVSVAAHCAHRTGTMKLPAQPTQKHNRWAGWQTVWWL